MEEPETPNFQIEGTAEMAGGVWANFAVVSHSPHEFTIDFVRLDYQTKNPTKGVVVQRVNISPLLVQQLIAALTDNLSKFAQKTPDGIFAEGDD
ncbi:MAG: DUF3467 domain-containing protein [Acidimicrobiaceae bacterium]|nr:DUF3467 domain-containing protein [Acidimicrobiaceae bacterium]MYC42635.1 DUF3467 domain-containing protein [Acidimicrobiaceae bacterium]MYH88241.1 DUF3467 domain-containing protein [Acidimicrobiaceae bacterium]